MKTLVMRPRVPLHPSALFPAVEDEAFSEDTRALTHLRAHGVVFYSTRHQKQMHLHDLYPDPSSPLRGLDIFIRERLPTVFIL